MKFSFINRGQWFSAEGYKIVINEETGLTYSLFCKGGADTYDYRNPIGKRYRTLEGAIKAAAKHHKQEVKILDRHRVADQVAKSNASVAGGTS